MTQNQENISSQNELSLAAYLFHQGTNFHSYDFLGAHISPDKKSVIFRVWAPNADEIYVCGDFNNWSKTASPMKKITDAGVWEVIIEGIDFFQNFKYKYRIVGGGFDRLKSDPYAFYSETREKSASILYDLSDFHWTDETWLKNRDMNFTKTGRSYSLPINIYEMHIASWKTQVGTSYPNSNNGSLYSELSKELLPYIKQMGYTHIELLPIMEHPYDASWGYQITGYFAPTSRFGSPHDFMSFINACHNEGIGIIFDWVPAHFPKDENGLYEFDGGPLYEYQGADRMEHKCWGTRCFDVGRNEVQSFLISNALFWMRNYHVDGLRTDAVASMLYLDYDRRAGEWNPNIYGTNESLEAIAFFKKLNSAVKKEFPSVMMIAEESTAWPKVSHPVADGGLGFDFKWNMGFANDIMSYVSTDPYFRSYDHGKLTFPIMYAYSENFILPLSHDEVVYGKRSIFNKMFGDELMKAAGFRVFMCHFMAHPGKKLTFMGTEYGQYNEWDHSKQLDWYLCENETHHKLLRFTSELNNFYLKNKELWELDFSANGFFWLIADDSSANVIAYQRKCANGDTVTVVLNFSNSFYHNYSLPINQDGIYQIVFSSDNKEYGGNGKVIKGALYKSENGILKLPLPQLCGLYLRYSGYTTSTTDNNVELEKLILDKTFILTQYDTGF